MNFPIFSSASIIKTRITEFGLERAIYSASDFTSWDIIWVDIPLSQLSRHTDIFEALEDGYDLFDNYDNCTETCSFLLISPYL